MDNQKLQRWALVAEIIGGFAIVISLVILISEVRNNTQATYMANRQSVAERTEYLLLSSATSPQLAEIRLKVIQGDTLSDIESLMYMDRLASFLRLAEESYLLYRDGQLSEEYWNTRASNLVDRMRVEFGREVWLNTWSQNGWFTADFTDWLNTEINTTYRE